MKNTILIFAAFAASIATAENVGVGLDPFAGSISSDGNVVVGDYIGRGSRGALNNIAIGRDSLSYATNVVDCIAIGANAGTGLANCYGSVMIGTGIGAGRFLPGSTSINDQFFASSLAGGLFAVNPNRESDLRDAPLYYKNGTLFFNGNVEMNGGPVGGSVRAVEGYDYYIAENGNDENDGLTWKTPKRNIWAVWDAMRLRDDLTNATCCAFAGTYMITNAMSSGELMNYTIHGPFSKYEKRVKFYAIDGKDRTVISAPSDNTERDAGQMVNLAISLHDTWIMNGAAWEGADSVGFGRGPYSDGYIYRFQEFHGFTFRNFASTAKDGISGATSKRCPAFVGFKFFDCIIEKCLFWDPSGYGSVFGCEFYDCTIRDCILYHSGGNSTSQVFCGCSFYRTKLTDCETYRPSGDTGKFYLLRSKITVRDSFFDIEDFTENDRLGYTASYPFVNSTFLIGGETYTGENEQANFDIATNCYFAVGTSPRRTGTNNEYAETWRDAKLTRDGVAASYDCPAVRLDGRDDAGWKNSGLAALKIAKTRADLRYIDGVLYVYQDGVAVATIAATPYAAPASAAPRRFMATPPPTVDEADDADAVYELRPITRK